MIRTDDASTDDASTDDASTDDYGTEGVTWDLTALLAGAGPGSATGAAAATSRAAIDALLDAAAALANGLQRHRGRIATLDASELAALMHDVEGVHDRLGRAGSYAQLLFTSDTGDAAAGALMAHVEERSTRIGTELVFIDLEWLTVDDDRAQALCADPQLAFCAHHLRSARRFAPHVCSEPEERILAEKAIAANSAWLRLHQEQLSALTVALDDGEIPFEAAFSELMSPSRERRAATHTAITASLAPGLRTRAYIYNVLAADHAVDDRLRHYAHWCSGRNLGNQTADPAVGALVEAVRARFGIARRWYRTKAALLGLDRLATYDRMAPIGDAPVRRIGWDEAREIVLDSYASFSPVLADGARRFFDERWIDAPVRPGKAGGAFCSPAVPTAHPYVLLNYTGAREDVLTLAHELGHGLHFLLSRGQSVFHHTTPLTVAETASVFGETITFNRLLAQEHDPAARLSLLAQHLEGQIATVFRQIAMWCFEDAVHTHRREEGELSVDRFGELWAASQAELLGDSVEIGDEYRSWWSYIPHFVHTPGYVYAYGFGQLLALSVYRRYEEEGAGFAERYLDLLRAGGSQPPEELAAMVGCDLADPGFWDAGLDLVERVGEQAEAAAKDQLATAQRA